MNASLFLIALVATAGSSFGQSYKIKVQGMVCSLCSQGIEKRLRGERGVSDVKIDLGKKEILVHTEKNEVRSEELKRQIEEAGSYVKSIEELPEGK